MDTLEELIDKINDLFTIYDIHHCNVGWGFVLYQGNGEFKWKGESWRNDLHVYLYRPTLRRAAEDTLKFLRKVKEVNDGS